MDKDLLDFEAELRGFRPRAVSPRLLAQLESTLAPCAAAPARPDRPAVNWTSSRWANWAAAAAFLVLASLGARFLPGDLGPGPRSDAAGRQGAATPAPVAGGSAYKPVAAVRTVYAGAGDPDGEVVTLADGRIARRVRSRYVDTITWRNPATNASVRWSVPREEVRIVPVAAY